MYSCPFSNISWTSSIFEIGHVVYNRTSTRFLRSIAGEYKRSLDSKRQVHFTDYTWSLRSWGSMFCVVCLSSTDFMIRLAGSGVVEALLPWPLSRSLCCPWVSKERFWSFKKSSDSDRALPVIGTGGLRSWEVSDGTFLSVAREFLGLTDASREIVEW